MNEFRCARAHATGSNKWKFLIPVLCGDLSVEDVNEELKFYLKNNTYLEYGDWVGTYLESWNLHYLIVDFSMYCCIMNYIIYIHA